jgi:uncharacterized protein YeaO (DUF488 family)
VASVNRIIAVARVPNARRIETMPHRLRVKRVYAPSEDGDGLRVLVDRLWPRGLTKDKARVDVWLKEIAPGNELRARFHGHPEAWDAFNAAYAQELKGEPAKSAVEELLSRLRETDVTLLYAARDEAHNNAVALREFLLSQTKK